MVTLDFLFRPKKERMGLHPDLRKNHLADKLQAYPLRRFLNRVAGCQSSDITGPLLLIWSADRPTDCLLHTVWPLRGLKS